MQFENEIIIETEDRASPRTKSSMGIFGAILGVFLWLLLTIAFLFGLYVHWFSKSVSFIFQLFKTGVYHVPFWLSAICVIFFFPFTVLIVIVVSLLQIFRGNAKI